MSNKLFSMIIFSVFISCGVESGGSGDTDGVPSGSHRVFVSSQSYSATDIGSLTNADTLCQQLAEDQGLALTYMAILSSEVTSAKSRLNFSGSIYKVDTLGDNFLIASLGSDLWNTDSENLLAEVNLDESGEVVTDYVWTGTNSDGGIKADSHCDSWTGTSGSGFGGDPSKDNSYWLEDSSLSCSSAYPIYCISQ